MDTIHIATVWAGGNRTIAPHRTLGGAVLAMMTIVDERLAGQPIGVVDGVPTPMTAHERSALHNHLMTHGDIQLSHGIPARVEGVDRQRLHSIASKVDRDFSISEVELGA